MEIAHHIALSKIEFIAYRINVDILLTGLFMRRYFCTATHGPDCRYVKVYLFKIPAMPIECCEDAHTVICYLQ